MTGVQQSFLSLVRLGIGHDLLSFQLSFDQIDWNSVMDLAEKQGLTAVVLDGVEKLPKKQMPPKTLLLQWIGSTLQSFEQRYELYRRAIASLSDFYNGHGFKMMVLKGYACSIDWPKPEHRPAGDIDIWLFGKYRLADEIISREAGIDVDTSEHHHTVFFWKGFLVENHYDFINIHHRKSNAEFERILKELVQDDSHSVELYGETVYIPSPDLHALFLLRHALAHFAATEITVRHLLDWGFFVEINTNEINWSWLIEVLNRFGMTEFFNTVIAICIEDLDFDKRLFPICHHNPEMKEKVLAEILCPQFSGEMPSNLFVRVIWKYRRWRANAWKHKLCYKESLWSAFWSGVWNHLLKPSTI